MLRFVTIAPHERGVLVRNKQPVRWLEPGSHVLLTLGAVARYDLGDGYLLHTPELEAIIPEPAVEVCEVPLAHRGLLTVDGLPAAVLSPGRYLVWKARVRTTLQIQDTRDPHAEIPEAFLPLIPTDERVTVTISDESRGLLSQRGRLVRVLEPGAHHLWDIDAQTRVQTTNLTVEAWRPELARLLDAAQATVLDVGPEQFALYWVDGQPRGTLAAGRYLLWQLRHAITAQLFETEPRFSDVPRPLWPMLSGAPVHNVSVESSQRGLLYIDGELVEELSPGRYLVNNHGRQVLVPMVDMREQQLLITGQEVMTADKVSLRVSVLLTYQITDARRSVEQTKDLDATLYSGVQLSARRTIAGMTVDRLLEKRTAARDAMQSELAEQAEAWGVEVKGLDLKDIVLPGEMKAIFNQVIEAQKRAAANVITRREETAATRSLANTAKMLEDNPTLLRLKELETLKEMAENIGELTVMATPDQLLKGLSLSK